jgi:hypothetical protein
MQKVCTSADRAEVARTPEERRQNFTTWGIVALAVFVSVGMAEWSKRTAMGEKVVSPQVLERALAIAEKMEDRRSEMGTSDFGFRNSDSGNNLSDLSVSAVKPLSTAEAQRRGGVLHSGGNEAGKIETSAGVEK